jgi:hypothetical protein
VAVTIDPTAIIVGAGVVYDRALSVLTPWASVGATMDDTVARINQSWFRPDLNGQLGPIQELDYKSEEVAQIEFTMMEVAGANLALAIPGATSAAGTGAVKSSGHLDTTLSAAVAAGATTIPCAAVTNAAVGDTIKIDVTAGAVIAEYRVITAIDTLNISFRDPLKYDHANGVAVEEADDDGRTTITGSTVRRMPSSAYKQWALVAEAPDGYYELALDSGISITEGAELTFGDETAAGIRTTIEARYAGSTPTTPPWRLRVPA